MQVIKWAIYSLLIVNFGFYVMEDLNRAIHTLREGDEAFKLTKEFATSIDTVAWLVLLMMFELETYVLEDEQWSGFTAFLVYATRLACYVMIVHTVVAFSVSANEYSETRVVEGVTNLCQMTDDRVSYVYNLKYTEVTEETCATLSDETTYYWLGDNPLVVTAAGLKRELHLVWSDLAEAIAWLVIIFAIELVVFLQNRDVTGGLIMVTANGLKLLCYLILVGLTVYWAVLGHFLYTWDSLLWVAGFVFIESNMHLWRDEIRAEHPGSAAGAALDQAV